MSTTRTVAYSSLDKPWAYVVLTKPDVTFLVVITTVAGFYLASPGHLDWALLMHTLFGTTLVGAGTAALNQYFERDMDAVMRRTAARPLPTGMLQPRDVLIFGIATIVVGGVWLALAVNLLASLLALATTVLYLGALHTSENSHYMGDGDWRVSRCTASADWLGGCARLAFGGGVGAVRDSLPLAISALHGDRLDVSRRLRARGNQNAAGGRSVGRRDIRADHWNVGDAGAHEPAACGDGNGGNSLFLWCVGAGDDSAASGAVGKSASRECPREVADARHGRAYSDSFGLDDI